MNSSRLSRWTALSIFTLAILGLGGLSALYLMGCERYVDSPTIGGPAAAYGEIVSLFGDVAFPFLGLLILKYRPQNRIGWFALLYGLFSIYGGIFQTLGNCNQVVGVDFSNSVLYVWLFDITSLLILIFFGLFLFTFPNGRSLSPRWRDATLILLIFMVVYTAVVLIGGMFSPVLFEYQQLANFLLPLFAFPLLGILSLFVRWMHSEGDERQQIKWVAFFFLTAGTLFISIEIIGTLYYPSIFGGWFYLANAALFVVGFPLVLGLTIFKYRLYDIDIIIRRTLVYSLVTIALVAVYFGSIISLQQLFTGVSGQESPLAIVVSTLLIAALFNPLRNKIQDIIDRRFYRKKYDAQQVLAKFAQTARDETDVDRLSVELTYAIKESMQPENLGIWLKKESP